MALAMIMCLLKSYPCLTSCDPDQFIGTLKREQRLAWKEVMIEVEDLH
jgi:hypothetical protein